MIYSISNAYLRVSAEDDGAQLKSIKSFLSGKEYLWQGDEKYWTGRAYNLFPIVGRMTDNKYLVDGQEYEMLIHGFIRRNRLTLNEISGDKMAFGYSSSDVTRPQYPFEFDYSVTFALKGNTLLITYDVKNKGDKEMVFAVGGHPGFNVPFGKGAFEDYYVDFPKAGKTAQLTMTDACFMTGEEVPYPLENGALKLQHGLFDRDVIILTNTDGVAYIRGNGVKANIKLTYPDMKYLGVWHKPKTDAPFVCLEPWSALPARDKVKEDLRLKPDYTHLGAGESYSNTYSIQINE